MALALTTTATAAALPASAASVERTPSGAVYEVSLSTGANGRSWTGREAITFENSGSEPLGSIWLRLWGNGNTGCADAPVGVSDVVGATAGSPAIRCTALELTLHTPLAPGATASVAFDVTIRPPTANDRFGWFAGTARLGNALPILAVHDDEGWHLDPFFAFGESFYSLVADWTVALRVPRSLQTPATGAVVSVEPIGGDRERRTFEATDVRDFAWLAGSYERASATDALGVRVRLWSPEGMLAARRADRLVHRASRMMDTFSDAFGAYPYDEVDLVIASFDSFGGMEYPQLVMAVPSPLVISHELAHQWWYGIVGDDEYEDPWVDEGFAQWSMFLPFERAPSGWPELPFTSCTMFPWPSDEVRVSSGVDYFDTHREEYYIPYWQGACALARLANAFGFRPFLDVLRDHAAAHWLDVATNADVMAAMESAAASAGLEIDLPAFWDRWRISRPAGLR